MQQTRDRLADILKGIGLVSVVIGHSGTLLPGLERIPIIQFVYLYHLMLFFFVAGMVFNPERYANAYVYIGRQIKAVYLPYIAYNICFLLLHNLMISIQMLDVAKYALSDFVIYGCNTLTLHYTETIVGSLWFVPMFLISKALFAIFFEMAEHCRFRMVGHTIVILIFATLGVYTNHFGMFLNNNLQTAMIGVPVIYLGYFFNKYREKLIKLVNPVSCIACAALMFAILYSGIGHIELSENQIISPALFYPVTILGMLFCVSLAKIILEFNLGTKVFSHLGTISFHIMAQHFIVFKCFDWTYGLIFNSDRAAMMRFPHALENLGWFYTVIGICVPTVLVCLFRHIKSNGFHFRGLRTLKEADSENGNP